MAKCYACPHAIDPDGYHGHCDLADRDMKLTDPTPGWCPLRGRWLATAFYLARAARKSQRMPLNPMVLEPVGSMRRRAERARRQWVYAVVAFLRWVNA
jgi:hypothetical protein